MLSPGCEARNVGLAGCDARRTLDGLALSDERPRWIGVDWDALGDIAVERAAGVLRGLIKAKFFF